MSLQLVVEVQAVLAALAVVVVLYNRDGLQLQLQ
jgi:hypothetical protein